MKEKGMYISVSERPWRPSLLAPFLKSHGTKFMRLRSSITGLSLMPAWDDYADFFRTDRAASINRFHSSEDVLAPPVMPVDLPLVSRAVNNCK